MVVDRDINCKLMVKDFLKPGLKVHLSDLFCWRWTTVYTDLVGNDGYADTTQRDLLLPYVLNKHDIDFSDQNRLRCVSRGDLSVIIAKRGFSSQFDCLSERRKNSTRVELPFPFITCLDFGLGSLKTCSLCQRWKTLFSWVWKQGLRMPKDDGRRPSARYSGPLCSPPRSRLPGPPAFWQPENGWL